MGFTGQKHGLRKTREWKIWRHMKQRCYCPSSINWHRYGGRGIKVCKRWLHSVENFVNDMGPAPSDKHSLERKNRNKDYSPGNCVWATAKEQSNNTVTNRRLRFNGKVKTVTQWCEELKLNRVTVYKRLEHGWTVKRSLTEPIRNGGSFWRRYVKSSSN